jgi:hypothetical protein
VVTKTYIAANLRRMERLYNSSLSVQNSLYYSKLAVIELCGWIEMSMDDIVLRLASKKLKDSKNRKYIEKDVVKRTHGFDYERHFLHMIEAVIGWHGIEKMNSQLDVALISPLTGALSALSAARNQLAHQYIKGTTLAIDAPSMTNVHFQKVLAGLKNIETVLLGSR